jgi:hypothetical protein
MRERHVEDGYMNQMSVEAAPDKDKSQEGKKLPSFVESDEFQKMEAQKSAFEKEEKEKLARLRAAKEKRYEIGAPQQM